MSTGSAHASWYAAVNDQHLSSDRLSAAEHDHLRSDVLYACHLTQHRLLPLHLGHLFRHPLRHTGAFDQARGDTVDRHVGGKGHRETTGEMDYARLARRVGDAATRRVQ